MRNYRVEFTEAENTACYMGEWYSEFIEADSYVEAFDLLKDYMLDCEFEPEEFVLRAKTAEDTEWVYD